MKIQTKTVLTTLNAKANNLCIHKHEQMHCIEFHVQHIARIKSPNFYNTSSIIMSLTQDCPRPVHIQVNTSI